MCEESKLRYNSVSMSLKGENTLIIDISSGSTGAALVHHTESGLPEMVARARTPFYVENGLTADELETAVLSSLDKSLASINAQMPLLSQKGYKGHLSHALVALSSPWVVSHLKTVIIRRDNGFVLDERMVKAVMSEEEELFKKKLTESFREESEVFESVVTNLYQNGYETPHPIKETIKEAEINFLLSATTKNLLHKIEGKLLKVVGLKRGLAVQSFVYAFYKVVTNSFQNLHSALFINVAPEITDLLFLRHGYSALSVSLPIGPAVIARAVAKEFNLSPELANSYLSLYVSNCFNQETNQKIETVFNQVKNDWKNIWHSMGESIPEGREVPYSVFLVVPTGFEKVMKLILESLLSDRNVILVGETNAFTKELVKAAPEVLGDEKLLILSSFANLLEI